MRKSGPPRGLISYLVLELLEEKPRYGYEILKEITEISGGHWEPSYGSVYPILYKFEDEGWAERIEREDEPDRKYFELTDAGREHLAEKRTETGGKAREFADVILGFYHVYVAFATDDRFETGAPADEWCFDDTYSGWIVEQMVRHHERDFGEFERVPDTPEEFYGKHGGSWEPAGEGSDGAGRDGEDADGEGTDDGADGGDAGGTEAEGQASDD
ncbi:PadR family transcriptional regulator [Halorarum salinum]|uniref:Helix-turn-helix transcriptional regulator n=1 Tax=Halorarum salinum TaxID=2743089 RepID=A0A7D5L9K5_9EURY|nr:PadR family transcriptional regulator [Halobaculum salinum]QLG61190.1 helix-turn-helix transcriptional regulator [Halobaculum salinum]